MTMFAVMAALATLGNAHGLEEVWDRAAPGIDGGAAVIAPGGAWQHSKHAQTARLPVASLSKLMTAQVTLQLIAEKQLSASTKARDVLGWLPPWMQEVTVEQLLTHTSGLPNMDACLGTGTDGLARIAITRSAQLRPLRSRINTCLGTTPANPPGSTFDYNNMDTLVLQAIIESLERRDFERVLRQRIFRPAGMTRSSLAPWGALPPDVLRSYRTVEGRAVPEDRFNIGLYGGAGGVISTLRDVTRWVEWSMQQPDAVSPLTAGSRYGQFQGFGAYAFTTDALGATPVAVVERPGATAYYQWQVSIVPERKTAVVVFALNDGAQLGNLWQKSGLAVDLLKIALGIPSSELQPADAARP